MGIDLVDWPEIMSEWQVTPENDDLRYAVTHPHKNLPIQGAKTCALRYLSVTEKIFDKTIKKYQGNISYWIPAYQGNDGRVVDENLWFRLGRVRKRSTP